MLVLVQYLPFWGLILLANWAERNRSVRIVAYAALVMFNLLLGLLALLLLLLHLLSGQPEMAASMAEIAELMTINFLHPAILFGLTSLLALVVMLPAVRRLMARLLPMDADSILDCTALVFTVYFVGLTAAQILFIGGVEGLSQIELDPSALDLLFSGLALVVFALLGVGWGIRRNARESLQRLKVEPMRRQHWPLALGLVVAFLLLDVVIRGIWVWLDPAGYERISGAAEALFGGLTALHLALPLAVATGIGEELLFRGAVQPRLGIWFTSIAFSLGHLQYGLSPALIQILIISLVLGRVRQKANTTTCMVVHGLYNLSQLVIVSQLAQFLE